MTSLTQKAMYYVILRFILQNSFWHTVERQYLGDHIPWQLRALWSHQNLPNYNRLQNFPKLTILGIKISPKKQYLKVSPLFRVKVWYFRMHSLTISVWPCSAAHMRAVEPSSSCAFTSHPFIKRSLTVSFRPCPHASIRAVWPSWKIFRIFISMTS